MRDFWVVEVGINAWNVGVEPWGARVQNVPNILSSSSAGMFIFREESTRLERHRLALSAAHHLYFLVNSWTARVACLQPRGDGSSVGMKPDR